jgi:putative membrane protein
MSAIATVLVGILAVEHVWILVLEMFLWTRPYGLRTFGNTPEKAEIMAVLAKNQGLYNGFLAAGLFWGLWLRGSDEGFHVKLFFSGCVLVAGIFGFATTGKRSILIGQALLASLALGALLLAGR